jgi:nucleoside-diphosphate-sugar epimerase
MRALVIGGTGYVGTRLVRALGEDGWNVTVFATAPPAAGAFEARFVAGDRDRPGDLARVGKQDYDAVFDLVAYRPAQTRAAAELLAGRTGRFVHLSTASVYARLPAPAATEEAAERCHSPAPSYAAEKARCEEALEEAGRTSGFPFVIVRAAPLMGPGDPVSRENHILKRILAGRPLLHPGPADGYVLVLYVDDLVRGMARAATAEGAAGRAYHLAHADPPTLAAHVAAIARLAGRPPCALELVPPERLAGAGFRFFAIPYAPASPARLDVGRAARELGWTPTPYPRALEETVSWLLARDPRSHPAWPGRGSTQSRLAGTHEWLHADLERLRGNGALPPFPAADPDQALSCLAGAQGDGAPWLALPLESCPPPEEWPAPDPGSARPVVLLPAALLARVTGRPAPREPVAWHPGWRLAAVLEPAPGLEGREAWLYAQTPPPAVQDYTHASDVPLVRFLGFREALAATAADGERLMASVEEPADAEAFRAWLGDCLRHGHARVPSLAWCARVHLVPAATRERLLAADPAAAAWADVFALARLLRASGEELPGGEARMRISTPARPLFPVPLLPGEPALRAPWMLFSAGERTFLGEVRAGRLLELPPPLAVAACVLQRTACEAEGVRSVAAMLGLPEDAAARLYDRAVEVLTGAGVLTPAEATSSRAAHPVAGSPLPT